MAFYNSGLKMTLALLLCSILTPRAHAPPSAGVFERQATTTTSTSSQPFVTPGPTGPCPQPCGFADQLCCAADQICYTDANNQAQCGPSVTSPGGGPSASCPLWSTSTYTTTMYFRTVSSYVVTYTRTERNVQVVVGTVSWQVTPLPSDCCAPPIGQPPTCNFAQGETPCGNTCCAPGEFCESAGFCAAINPSGGGSDYYSYYTTTYVETDLGTVTKTFSTLVTVT